jgi:hypothetical protein
MKNIKDTWFIANLRTQFNLISSFFEFIRLIPFFVDGDDKAVT